MNGRFENKKVFVTAAGAGFGRATATAFANEGASEVCVVERLADRLDAVCATVENAGARAIPILADLGETRDCKNALDEALQICGRIDIAVLNHAAMTLGRAFLDLSEADWDKELRVNLTSHIMLAQGIAKRMVDDGGGVILFTASVNALGAERGYSAYCVTKAALVTLTQAMAVELAQSGIRVNCVSPGPADTQRSVDLVGVDAMERFRRSFPIAPMNRLASADDIADAFLYLASDAASYVTGHNLVVDGGLTAQLYDLPE